MSSKRKVLIVDDNNNSLRYLEKHVKKVLDDWTILKSDNYIDAIHLINCHELDILICDLYLRQNEDLISLKSYVPSGIEISKLARNNYEGCFIIIISSNFNSFVSNYELLDYIDAGVNIFLDRASNPYKIFKENLKYQLQIIKNSSFSENEMIHKFQENQKCKKNAQKSLVNNLELNILNNDMKIIKIFLASSSELERDRQEFEIFIARKNPEYIKHNCYLELVLWENFIDAMSITRLQDEYNNAIKECDIFVSLFYTKVGKYTEEEFFKAFSSFKVDNKPIIYTYFKDSQIKMSEITPNVMSLFKFQEKLRELGHFQTNYSDISDLKYKFGEQLIKIIPKLLNR